MLEYSIAAIVVAALHDKGNLAKYPLCFKEADVQRLASEAEGDPALQNVFAKGTQSARIAQLAGWIAERVEASRVFLESPDGAKVLKRRDPDTFRRVQKSRRLDRLPPGASVN